MAVPDEKPWYEELDAEEYADLFPRGQADVDAWIERDAWREQHQGMPRTCEDAGTLEGLARLILSTSTGTADAAS